jgi:predicted nuclease of predicted toxin-antitoxin system
VRLLLDECVSGPVVARLRAAGHDCRWIAEVAPGEADPSVLQFSVEERRIVITEDWGFGELAIRQGKPAYGVVIVAMPQLAGDIDTIADLLLHRLTEQEESLIGKLTIIEAGRVRQRELPKPAGAEEE